MVEPATVPLWVPLVSAAGGGLLVGLVNFAINWQNKLFEERKHNKELMLNVALEQWKQSCVVFIEEMKLNRTSRLAPLDAFIIHLTKLSEVLTNSKITKDNISDKLREVHEVASEVQAFIENENRKEKERLAKAKEKTS